MQCSLFCLPQGILSRLLFVWLCTTNVPALSCASRSYNKDCFIRVMIPTEELSIDLVLSDLCNQSGKYALEWHVNAGFSIRKLKVTYEVFWRTNYCLCPRRRLLEEPTLLFTDKNALVDLSLQAVDIGNKRGFCTFEDRLLLILENNRNKLRYLTLYCIPETMWTGDRLTSVLSVVAPCNLRSFSIHGHVVLDYPSFYDGIVMECRTDNKED